MLRRMESRDWLVLLASVSVGTSILIGREGVKLKRDGEEGKLIKTEKEVNMQSFFK